MSINANVDFKSIYDMCDDGQKGAMWRYVSQQLKSYVKRLMALGIDINGKRYKAYSTSYSKKRTKDGLTARVNLEFSSQMKLSITARNRNDRFEIFLVGTDNNNKAEWVSETREFLAWGNKTELALNRYINNYFKLKGWV